METTSTLNLIYIHKSAGVMIVAHYAELSLSVVLCIIRRFFNVGVHCGVGCIGAALFFCHVFPNSFLSEVLNGFQFFVKRHLPCQEW